MDRLIKTIKPINQPYSHSFNSVTLTKKPVKSQVTWTRCLIHTSSFNWTCLLHLTDKHSPVQSPKSGPGLTDPVQLRVKRPEEKTVTAPSFISSDEPVHTHTPKHTPIDTHTQTPCAVAERNTHTGNLIAQSSTEMEREILSFTLYYLSLSLSLWHLSSCFMIHFQFKSVSTGTNTHNKIRAI